MGHSGKVGQHTIPYLSGADLGGYLYHFTWCPSSELSHLEKSQLLPVPRSINVYPEKMERGLCQGCNVRSKMEEQARSRPQREEHRALTAWNLRSQHRSKKIKL